MSKTVLQIRVGQALTQAQVNTSVVVTAEQSAVYQLVWADTNKAVEDVVLRRKGDALLIEADGQPEVRIEKFFQDGALVAYDLGTTSGAGASPLVTPDAVAAADTGIVWQPGNGAGAIDASPSVNWGGFAGLFGGAVVLLANDDDNNASSDAPVEPDDAIVVFDLVDGVSSDHSERTFKDDVAYTVYIVVDSDSEFLNTGATTGPGTWGTWTGANKLGAGDRIILVGNDGPVLNYRSIFPGPAAVTRYTVSSLGAFIRWIGPTPGPGNPSSSGGAAYITDLGKFGRLYSDNGPREVRLWSGTAFLSLMPSALNLTSVYLTNVTKMPAGVMTSQGLA